MTDLLGQGLQAAPDPQTPDSQTTTPVTPMASPAPVLPGLDLGAIDQKIQTVHAVQQSWGFPPLPDAVKLDLASQHQLDHQGLGDFLWGIASDLNRAINPLASPPAAAATLAAPGTTTLTLPDPNPNSADNQVRRLFAGISGEAAPTALASDATQALKRKAITQGLVPADTPVDGSWDPAWESVYHQLQNQDFQKRISGDRPGSLSVNSVVHFLGDWLSPSGLGKAGAALGVVPAAGAVKGYFGGLVHNIGAWLDHPTDPKAFLTMLHAEEEAFRPGQAIGESIGNKVTGQKTDAITAASTGVQLPVINDMLLVSGIGEVVAAGRAATMGDEAYQAARAGIYAEQAGQGGAKGLWASKMLAAGPQLERTAEASRLSDYTFRAGTALGDNVAGRSVQGTGLAMQQWRDLKAVQVAKVASRALAQRGLAATAESKLFPDTNLYAGNPIASAAGVTNAKTLEQFKRQQLPYGISQVWDLGLAPPSYFQPGQLSQIGTVTKDLLSKMGSVNDDVRMTYEAAQGIRGTITDPAELARFDDLIKTGGYKQALIDWHGGDPDLAAFTSTWQAAVTAVERDAVARAAVLDKTTDPAQWEHAFWNVKAGTVGQVSHIDPGDTFSFLNRVAANSGDPNAVRRWMSYLQDDPENANRLIDVLIQHNNDMRTGVLNSLISQLQPGDISSHVQRFFGPDGNTANFLAATDHLAEITKPGGLVETGGFTPSYKPALSPAGRVVGGSNAIDPAANVSKDLLRIMQEDPSLISESWMTPLARPIGSGQYTVARLETPVKQDADTLLASVKTQQRTVDTLKWLESQPDVQERFAGLIQGAGRPLEDVSRADWAQAMQEAWAEAQGPSSVANPNAADLTFQPGPSPKTAKAGKLLRVLGAQTDEAGQPLYDFSQTRALPGSGINVMPDVTTARQAAEARLNELADHPQWDQFGIANRFDLPTKVKKLSALRNYIAAEVTGLPQESLDHLSGLGYKVVYGGNFLTPKDVMDSVRPLAEVSQLARFRMSLGTFITPAADSQVGRLVAMKLHSDLTDGLVKAGAVDAEAVRNSVDNGESGTVGDVIHRLWEKVDVGKNTTEQLVQQSREQGSLAKLVANFQSSKTALGIRDLTMAQMKDALPEFADNQRAMNAIYGAVKSSHDVGAQYQGLQALEDHWRANNLITSALKTFGKTEPGNRLNRAAIGAGVGALAGGTGALVGGKGLADVAKQAVEGAAVGGALGAGGAMATRGVAGAVPGAVIGGIGAAATGHPFAQGALGGAVAGAGLGIGAGPAIASKLAPMVEGSSWYRYGYLPEGLAKARNYARFTVSPFFDLRRYTKGAFLAQTANLPEGVTLPLNNSLQALARSSGPEAVQEAKSLWDAASRGQYGIVEDTERFFAQRGIFGYSPQEFQAATNYRLIQQGVDPEQAYGITRKIYAYGTGRSPLEKSVNFIFFPFSFEKKVVANAAQFLGSDMTRVAMLHDAMQTYNVLNQHYDLSKMWQDHLPVLADLQKMNALEHGLSPGELGGVNAPILNFFKPQLMAIENGSDAHTLQQRVSRLLPVYNDIDRLTQDLASQGHVMFSPSHQTAQAEADAGFASWSKLKGEVDRAAKAAGYPGYTSIYASKNLAPVKDYVENQKAGLFQQYPGFEKTLLDAGRNRDQLNAEVLQMEARVAKNEAPPAERQLVAFHALEGQANQVAQQVGINTSDPSNMPPQVLDFLRQRALQYAMTGQGFEQLYNRYYRRLYGPISKEI